MTHSDHSLLELPSQLKTRKILHTQPFKFQYERKYKVSNIIQILLRIKSTSLTYRNVTVVVIVVVVVRLSHVASVSVTGKVH